MAREDEGRSSEGAVGLLVCVKCGREYYFTDGEAAPADLTCDKCGNTVFREFGDAESPGEAAADFRDESDRALDPDDPAGEATRGDLHDLNNP